ncbi:group II intron reverse transcriptase/maturase [Candidatus Thiosymbion oneisti]|uniref:group II intron reverse transcriptase/maturase n=1 Tax=Candidatus Thiosymbion oneisti TaxID=589554 RepID=UPI001C403AEE|nr:group II intron reverse transcriptase/maturase [Candidatus Thiosymbion oneisti]
MSEQNRTITERTHVELPTTFAVNESGLPEKVFKLRKQLYIKAKQEPRFRFYALYDRILRPDVLAAAWDQVAANDGAPGVDGVRVEDIESAPGGVERLMEELHDDLKRKHYRPQAVRLKLIPKANGGERPLGIPTVRDRVVQTAAKLVLEPIFEADFLPVSFGFRPGRSAHDALDAVQAGLKAGQNAVYDADLKGYFDTIPHHKLMACVERRIADGAVLKLIRQWLRAPILEEPTDRHQPPRKVKRRAGTPQGGVISPLLANLYLHWMDKRFHGPEGPAQRSGARLVRYADDFVILARYQGRCISDWIDATVEDWMGLKINREKTRIIKLSEPGASLDFLGYRLRYERDRFGRAKRFLNRVPSPKACAREREKLRGMIGAKQSVVPIPKLVARVNRQVRGWANYFEHGRSRPAFRALNWFLQQRMVRHLKRRSQRPFRPPKGVTWYTHLYKRLGLVQL